MGRCSRRSEVGFVPGNRGVALRPSRATSVERERNGAGDLEGQEEEIERLAVTVFGKAGPSSPAENVGPGESIFLGRRELYCGMCMGEERSG